MEYYLDAMEHHGLKGHLPQPDNFTTCGKLGIEINQYNCPIEVNNSNIAFILNISKTKLFFSACSCKVDL